MNTSVSRPLQQPLFRALWIAAVASNIGTWMQNVGGVWLMTSLTPSPLMVALMQTATSLPVFLVGLPAGALADIVDRRRLLLFWQGWMLVAAAGKSSADLSWSNYAEFTVNAHIRPWLGGGDECPCLASDHPGTGIPQRPTSSCDVEWRWY